MNKLEILKKARALITPPEAWTQGAYAKDKDGFHVAGASPNAVCFCAYGALKAAGSERPSTEGILRLLRDDEQIERYNDSHTHEEVLQMFDDALTRIEEEVE